MRYGTVEGVKTRVSRLVMGSMVFSREKLQLTCDLMDRFVEAGGTAVDTARVYAGGTSEWAFGEWLRQRGGRDTMVVIGKGAHHDSKTFTRRVNAAAIHEDIQTSLREMQLDRMDMYILHKDDPGAPVGPVIDALNAEVEAGRIGAFGGSSWSHQRIAAANAYAASRGLRPFGVSSPNLALAVPVEPMWVGCVSIAGDAEAMAWYQKTRLAVFAWSSQARGFFSGRYSPTITAGDPNVIRVYYSAANWERHRRASELATRRGRTLAQITLAWVLHQPIEIYALIGPATVAELNDSLGALEVELSPAELAWLNLEDDPAAIPAVASQSAATV